MIERVRDVEQQRGRARMRSSRHSPGAPTEMRRRAPAEHRRPPPRPAWRARARRAPGSAHAGVLRGISAMSVSIALEIHRATAERVGIDHQKRLAEPRPVALVDEERRRLEADRRAGERRHEQLDDERQHRALRAAHRQHRARRDRPWGRWSAVRRASSAQPDGMARPSFAAIISLPRATSDSDRSIDERRPVASRKDRGDRIGAEQRSLAAGHGHRRRRVAERETDHARCRDGHAGDTPRRRNDGCCVTPANATPCSRARRIASSTASAHAGNARPQCASTSTAPPFACDDRRLRVAVGAAVAQGASHTA